jgi:hypothetical protein
MSVEFGTPVPSHAHQSTHWVLRSMTKHEGAYRYATDKEPTSDLNGAKMFDTLEHAETERAARKQITEWVPVVVTRDANGIHLGTEAVTDADAGIEEI